MNAYKKFTKKFIDLVNSHLGYTITDVTYSCYAEKDQAVTFKIEEIPGWLFGLWYKTYETGVEYIYGTLFAQYEDAINKFKPSCSNVKTEIYICLDQYNEIDFAVERLLNNIYKDQALAFCIAHDGWTEWEYHTKEEARQSFKEYKKFVKDRAKTFEKYKKKYYNFMSKELLPQLPGQSQIIDYGEDVAPRYEILLQNKDIKAGYYYHITKVAEQLNLNIDKTLKKLEQLDKELETISRTNNYYIWPHIFFCGFVHVIPSSKKRK